MTRPFVPSFFACLYTCLLVLCRSSAGSEQHESPMGGKFVSLGPLYSYHMTCSVNILCQRRNYTCPTRYPWKKVWWVWDLYRVTNPFQPHPMHRKTHQPVLFQLPYLQVWPCSIPFYRYKPMGKVFCAKSVHVV
jgi:hypothetical protein